MLIILLCHRICNRDILEENRTGIIVIEKAGPWDNLLSDNEVKQETLAVNQHNTTAVRAE